MSDIDERRVGGHLVQIDRNLCVGFGDCIDTAVQAFELDDEGIAVFAAGVDEVPTKALLEACDACPVDAIAVFDEQGTQVVP